MGSLSAGISSPWAKERDCPFRGRLPASGAVRSVSRTITITGIDDHDRPEIAITFDRK
jgi:hypothetical protein